MENQHGSKSGQVLRTVGSVTRPPFWRNPFVADPDTATEKRRRKSYGSEERRGYFDSRREAMKTLYRDGATLEEIGAVYGVTRERARQVIAGTATRGTGLDPIKTINVCRKAQSLSAAVIELGKGGKHAAIRAFLVQTGYWPAMKRLWQWRRHQAYQHFTDKQLLAKLVGLAEKLGHTPGMTECNADPDMPSHTTYVRRWGNWAPACAAAGLRPMVSGARGHKNRDPNTGLKYQCKRGHPLVEGNLYRYLDNGKEKRVCKACAKMRADAERQALIDAGKLKPRKQRRTHLNDPEVVAARNSFAA